MSDKLTGIIMGALEGAESGDDTGGSGAGVDAVDLDGGADGADDTGTDAAGDASAESGPGDDSGAADAGDASTAEPAKAAEPDPLTAELEELGLRTPEPGSNNRIPYPRVRKIVQNAIDKRTKQHEALLSDINGKLSTAKERADAAERVDNLIATDFPRYLQLLETLHPQAKDAIAAFRNPKAAEKATAAAEPALPEAPPFDHKFEDGSLGYTQEGYKKYQQWVLDVAEARAEARAEKRFEEKYGTVIAPLVTEQRNRAVVKQSTEFLQARVSEATKVWGTSFTDDWNKGDKGEIIGYAKAHPQATFEQVVQAVLVPKMLADRTKMRKDVLDEGNVRAAAASKSTSAARAPEKAETVSLDDQIKQAMVAAGIA